MQKEEAQEKQEVDSIDEIEEAEDSLVSQKEAELEERIKELEDRYLRTHADFENTKKRLEKDKAQSLEYANQHLLKDLLPIADSLDKALESASTTENADKIAEGLRLIIDNLLKVFGKHGVDAIETDVEFNPELHEAVMHVKQEDKAEGEIAQVLQKGYRYKDRTLRAAMVSVVKN